MHRECILDPLNYLLKSRGILKNESGGGFVLLGYGLCGNTVENVERLIADADVPVVISREEGVILNNSIEVALGRERVQSLLHAEGGTYFLTPAGTSAIKDIQRIPESDGILGVGKDIDVSKIDLLRIKGNPYAKAFN